MKKFNKFISLLVVVLLALPVSLIPSFALAATPTTIFSDGFEAPTGLGNWTAVGWNSNSSGHTGSKSASLVGANNAQTMSKNISTVGYENLTMSYWYKGHSLDSSDHDKVEVFYTLDGSTWTEISSAQIDSTNDDDNWHKFTFSSFPSGANNNPSFGIKFDGDLNSGNDKVWVDDFSVIGTEVNTPPIVTLIGSQTVHVNQGDTYTDAGATANDTQDGDITANIVKGGSVDTNTPNTYILTFDVTDSGGLSATQVTRTVIVDPKQCNSNVSQVIYSTAGDSVNDGANDVSAVATWAHPSWVTLPGATWIWHEANVSNPESDQTDIFTKTINITGAVTSASLEIAADNGYIVEINGNEVVNKISDENSFGAIASYDVSSYLNSGSNTLKITAKNFALAGSNSESNPAGIIYKLSINSDECQTPEPEPQTATVIATKIVCDSESDLPNWGNGSGPNITSTTATDYVSSHSNCKLEPDWKFQWAPNGTSNPGDNILSEASSPWTTFGPTDVNGVATAQIPAGALTWLREVLKEGFVGFSGDLNSEQNPTNPTSAEMYCNTDVLNYDNYDWIDPVSAGQTYYCVAFNAKTEVPPPPTTSTVKICKFDQSEKPLSGWTVMLKGDEVQSGLTVPTNISAGINSTDLTSGVSYIAESSGTWMNQNGANPADTEYSTTDSWSTHMDGYTGYQTDILELQINSQFDPNSNWGAYNSNHIYAQSFIPSTNGPANFRIFDGSGTTQNEDWFGDNSGTLNVDIYKGYAGITGDDGCVTFNDVPQGSYSVGEVMQDGWSNTSGLGEVTVNGESNVFNISNTNTVTPSEEENDVCPNIEGTQTSVPEGKVLKDGNCVAQEQENNQEENNEQQEEQHGGGANGPINFGYVAPGGSVLGASISKDEEGNSNSCTPYITTYMKYGKKNDTDEVKKLQTFLNEYMGLNLPVTGYFGTATRDAVKQFQIKENDEVLMPWLKAGFSKQDKEATGYVYKTTLRRINLIKCQTLDIPMPQLP